MGPNLIPHPCNTNLRMVLAATFLTLLALSSASKFPLEKDDGKYEAVAYADGRARARTLNSSPLPKSSDLQILHSSHSLDFGECPNSVPTPPHVKMSCSYNPRKLQPSLLTDPEFQKNFGKSVAEEPTTEDEETKIQKAEDSKKAPSAEEDEEDEEEEEEEEGEEDDGKETAFFEMDEDPVQDNK